MELKQPENFINVSIHQSSLKEDMMNLMRKYKGAMITNSLKQQIESDLDFILHKYNLHNDLRLNLNYSNNSFSIEGDKYIDKLALNGIINS